MRKNWSKAEDAILKKIVGETGLTDWTSVATKLRQKYQTIQRTGKQCRQRWYNHLDPSVNKKEWTYEEECKLFEYHKELGNRWKDISHLLKGRTDNNIKNHFYSTLRRSLRRLNKIIGQKNSTMHMREIKPSVLTIILNFIYDHQEPAEGMTKQEGGLIAELKDLPKLIFQFAQFKPVKQNMRRESKEHYRQKIQIIFGLVEQFKESYGQQKGEKKKKQSKTVRIKELSQIKIQENREEQEEYSQNYSEMHSKRSQRPHQFFNSVERPMHSIQKPSSQKQIFCDVFNPSHQMLQLQDPSPLTSLDNENNPFPELVIFGKHLSPILKEVEDDMLPEQNNQIDEILYMNYE